MHCVRKLIRHFQNFRRRNNKRQILFNVNRSSCIILSEPEQFYEKYRENVEVSHCWTKPYRRHPRRDDTTEGESIWQRKKHRSRTSVASTKKKKCTRNAMRDPTSKVSSRNARGRDLEKASRDPNLASPIVTDSPTSDTGVQFLPDTPGVCLLTLNSPPQPSSNSKRYPSIAGPLCPAQPIIPCPGGGCQATVTLLFSALHSSGISKGAPGARNTCVETV